MRGHMLCLAMIAAAGLLGGCSTVAGEAYGKFKGPEGVFIETRPVSDMKNPYALSQYTQFQFGELRDDFGGMTPSVFFSDLQTDLPVQLDKQKLLIQSGGKTLLINVQVVLYEGRGSMALLLSDIEQVVARVTLVDKSTGKVVGQATCVGRTTTRTNFGVKYKAEGLARAIAQWIGNYYPKAKQKD